MGHFRTTKGLTLGCFSGTLRVAVLPNEHPKVRGAYVQGRGVDGCKCTHKSIAIGGTVLDTDQL